MRLPFTPLLFCWLPTLSAYALDLQEGFNYLTQIRTDAGLRPLTAHPQLAQSATHHARYLQRNGLQGHLQLPNTPGFSGETVAERVVAAGYPSRQVTENISTHSDNVSPRQSIESLMGAIYHRFGFLNFAMDEIGLGYSANEAIHVFVYNLGNSAVRQLCSGSSFTGQESYYHKVCADPDFRISYVAMDEARATVGSKHRDRVVWPVPDSHDIPPAFYEEDPDPLPAYSVSGYPISVQFNPLFYEGNAPQIDRFELFRVRDGSPVEPTLLLTAATDPNHKLTPLEFALFPLQRLDWGSRYRVELAYQVSGMVHLMEWQFTTRDLKLPLYVIHKSGEYISARSGQPFAVYIPPESDQDDNSDVSWRYTPTLKEFKVESIDGNTLKIYASGSGRAKIKFHSTLFEVVL